jgi:hypothetical protein
MVKNPVAASTGGTPCGSVGVDEVCAQIERLHGLSSKKNVQKARARLLDNPIRHYLKTIVAE